MAAKKTADPDAATYEGRHPKAAETDAARLKARSGVRKDMRKAQRLEQGEKDRQKARAELDKIREDSAKVLADKA